MVFPKFHAIWELSVYSLEALNAQIVPSASLLLQKVLLSVSLFTPVIIQSTVKAQYHVQKEVTRWESQPSALLAILGISLMRKVEPHVNLPELVIMQTSMEPQKFRAHSATTPIKLVRLNASHVNQDIMQTR